MNEQLICPYCGEVQYGHEPDVITSHMCLTTCEHCDREFWYAVNIVRTYTSSLKDD